VRNSFLSLNVFFLLYLMLLGYFVALKSLFWFYFVLHETKKKENVTNRKYRFCQNVYLCSDLPNNMDITINIINL